MSEFLLYPGKFIPPTEAVFNLPDIAWIPNTNQPPDEEHQTDEEFYIQPLHEIIPLLNFILITNSFPVFIEPQAIEGESYTVPLHEIIPIPDLIHIVNVLPVFEEEDPIQNTSTYTSWEEIITAVPVPDLIITVGIENIFEEGDAIQDTVFVPPTDAVFNLINIGWVTITNVPPDDIEPLVQEGGIFSQIDEGDFVVIVPPDYIPITNVFPIFEEHQTLVGEFLYGGTAFDADGIEFYESSTTVVRSILDHVEQTSIDSTDWILIQREDGTYRKVKATILDGNPLWRIG